MNTTMNKLNTAKLSTNKATSVIIWLIGAWLTAQTLHQLNIPYPVNIIVGLAIQFALTRAESPIWRGKGFPKMGIAATVVDVAVNAAGAWPYIKLLGNTDFWKMLQDLMQSPADPTLATLVVLVIGVGAFTACAAEYFWNLPE